MTNCPDCGYGLIDNGNVCSHCGWVTPRAAGSAKTVPSMTIPPYTRTLPTCQAWYFWKPEEAFTGDPLWVFHDDNAYGADKAAPLRTNSALGSTPAELGGLWSGPIFDPDEDMDQAVEIAANADAVVCGNCGKPATWKAVHPEAEQVLACDDCMKRQGMTLPQRLDPQQNISAQQRPQQP